MWNTSIVLTLRKIFDSFSIMHVLQHPDQFETEYFNIVKKPDIAKEKKMLADINLAVASISLGPWVF
jgi:hypothetical protein